MGQPPSWGPCCNMCRDNLQNMRCVFHHFISLPSGDQFILRFRPCRRLLGCWLVGFLLLGFVFPNVFARAPLFSGFQFPGHFFKTTMMSEVDAIMFGARECHSASLVFPFWNLGGRFWQLGGTLGGQGSSKMNTFESGVGFFMIWDGFRGPILKAFPLI